MPIPFQIKDLRTDLAEPSREAEFLRGLTASYRDIYVSILSIVGNHADAEDVLQEVCVVLWQRFDEFEPGTNFRKWACAFAFNMARFHARQQRRRKGLGLSDEALKELTHDQMGGGELFELRRELLRNCLARLKSKDRQFLMNCYSARTTLTEYAQKEEIPVATVYTRLKRIRSLLVGCINRSLGRGEGQL
ncbi:MAG TPA: sigma-70 family RNA polymerase sigma factor [Planctomicrobium sp.]|nr:sigma-70 family RNA polymerase sigma factor [Planctomicrobium sp.]